MPVFVKHSTESVTSSYMKGGVLVRCREYRGQWVERAGVRDALVRAVLVVELLELPQRVQEGAGSRSTCGPL